MDVGGGGVWTLGSLAATLGSSPCPPGQTLGQQQSPWCDKQHSLVLEDTV